jgi:hypothetical protein
VTFVNDLRTGRALPDDIHHHIAVWHDGLDDGVPLHEFLGMSWDEYRAWAERGELPSALS